MKSCTRCLLPETADTITFDEQGVCGVCHQIDYRDEKIDWGQRLKMLQELCDQHRHKGDYDCIVPFSGGKDSTFQLWYIIKKLGMKPLVVRFDHGFYRPLVEENNRRTFKKLGCDVINFTPNWHVVRELMLEALKRRGDFCWHCHTGIFAHTMQVALRYQIPLLIWGETVAEYQSFYTYEEMQEVGERYFNQAMNLGITADDMHLFLNGRVDKRDLYPFAYPPRKELEKLGVRSVALGNYIKWDTKKQVDIIKAELGWQGQEVEGCPPEFDYEKIECFFQGVRDYLKFIKRGMGRTNHLVNVDIRNKRMTREEGKKLVEAFDGKRPPSLDLFLDYLQISEDDFLAIATQHVVSPHVFNSKEIEPGSRMPDMDKWDRTEVSWPNHPGVKIERV